MDNMNIQGKASFQVGPLRFEVGTGEPTPEPAQVSAEVAALKKKRDELLAEVHTISKRIKQIGG